MTDQPAQAGRYETLRRLAVGGMGEIFLARERGRLGFSRLVVIKRMLPELARKPGFVDMFVDEARIVGHLSHPNICQILELGEEDGVPFLALEYVRGDSLSGIWDRAVRVGVNVPRAVTLRMLADTAWALHHAHESCDADGRPLNVIHRDISPHNVMVSFHGDVKLMDFGIARAENRMHRTDTGKIKGKIAYMAPEQLRNRPLDRRADVFAVGVMLWELTLNRRLFGGSGEVETLQKAVSCQVPPPHTIDPEYPPALEAIVMSALQADPERRTANAGELAKALVDQVTLLGGAERSAVAALMRQLFPDEIDTPEDTIPTRSWIDSEDLDLFEETKVAPPRKTATVSASTLEPARPTVPMRVTGPPDPANALSSPPIAAVPMARNVLASNPPMPSSSIAAMSNTPIRSNAPSARAPRYRWRVLGVVAILAIAGAITIGLAMRDPDTTPNPVSATSSTVPLASAPASTPPTATATPSPSPNPNPTPDPSTSPSPTPSSTPNPSPTPSSTPNPSPSPTPNPNPSPNPNPGPGPGPTATVTATPSPGPKPTPTSTPGPSSATPNSDRSRPNSTHLAVTPPRHPAGDSASHPAAATTGGTDAGVSGPASTPAGDSSPGTGTLAVSSELTGVVVIDGVRRKSTPFQTEVVGGDHDVALELSEGAGTLRAKVRVTPGRKTKCKADHATLQCSPSQSPR